MDPGMTRMQILQRGEVEILPKDPSMSPPPSHRRCMHHGKKQVNTTEHQLLFNWLINCHI